MYGISGWLCDTNFSRYKKKLDEIGSLNINNGNHIQVKHYLSLYRYFYHKEPDTIEDFVKFQVDFSFWKEIGLLETVLLK